MAALVVEMFKVPDNPRFSVGIEKVTTAVAVPLAGTVTLGGLMAEIQSSDRSIGPIDDRCSQINVASETTAAGQRDGDHIGRTKLCRYRWLVDTDIEPWRRLVLTGRRAAITVRVVAVVAGLALTRVERPITTGGGDVVISPTSTIDLTGTGDQRKTKKRGQDGSAHDVAQPIQQLYPR